ncbi:MAG: chromosome segregation ATPase [Planctomycetota bacterium]
MFTQKWATLARNIKIDPAFRARSKPHMFKSFFKVGLGVVVLTGAGLGGALLIAGPQRTHAVMNQVHTDILQQIDANVDDPTALRSQLRDLEAEYPERIGQVRGDLAELREQVRQLQRDQAICERVVEMASADFSALEPVLNEATAMRMQNGASAVSVVAWDDKVYSYDRASNQLNQVRQTLMAYTNRSADAKHDLVYLQQQEGRLEELLMTLETERAQFQTQITQLTRQVDAIARNGRLIGLLEKRNKTIEDCSRYEGISLDNLTSRLDEIRNRQTAELDILSNSQKQVDYEDMARMQINRTGMERGTFSAQPLPLPAITTAD